LNNGEAQAPRFHLILNNQNSCACQSRFECAILEFGQRFIFEEAALTLAGELREDVERNGWKNATPRPRL
jgi:hypothetical protein